MMSDRLQEMVRKAYDMTAGEEAASGNFRIKQSLVPPLTERIRRCVNRSRELVRESILVPDFLDILVERFERGNSMTSAEKVRPPYSYKMLSYLALVSLCPPSSLQQIIVFLRFLFPFLENSIDTRAFQPSDFEASMDSDERVQQYIKHNGTKMFVLSDGMFPDVLHTVRQFFATKSNYDRLKSSIFIPEFVEILLPDLAR